MPWQMPSPPPGLVELLKRGGQVPPTGAPGQPAAQPAPMAPSGQDAIRAAVAPAPVQPAQAPPPASDDPAVNPISKLPPVPTPPDMSNSPVVGLQKQMADTSSQISNVPRPDPSKYKPSILRRIAGGLTAGAAAYGHNPNAMEIGENVVNAPWNQAQTQYKRTISPLQQQLETERQQLPAAEAAAKIPQTAWENSMKQRTEQRETATAQSNAGYKSDLNDIRTMLDTNKHDEALKKIDETAEKNKNDLDLKNQLLDLKNQALELKREQIEKNGATTGKPNDFNRVGYKKSDAEEDADKAYNKAVAELTKPPTTKPKDMTDAQYQSVQQEYQEGLNAAQSEKNTAYSRSQRDYEQGVETLGGTAEHVTYDEKGVAHTTKPQGSPAATAQTAADPHDPNFWKSREGKKVTFSDGSVWQYLKGGKPEQIKAPTKK